MSVNKDWTREDNFAQFEEHRQRLSTQSGKRLAETVIMTALCSSRRPVVGDGTRAFKSGTLDKLTAKDFQPDRDYFNNLQKHEDRQRHSSSHPRTRC